MKALKKSLCIAALGFLLASCIQVDDLGANWSKGTIDPALAGRWLMHPREGLSDQGDKYYSFTLDKDVYKIAPEENPEDYMLAKTLMVGNTKMLMLHEPEEGKAPAVAPIKGDLWPYQVTGDKIVFPRLNPKSGAAVSAQSGGIVKPGDPQSEVPQYYITTLDDAALAALAKLGADPGLWETWLTGDKISAGQ